MLKARLLLTKRSVTLPTLPELVRCAFVLFNLFRIIAVCQDARRIATHDGVRRDILRND